MNAEGLLTYEDLRTALGGTRPLSLRQVKRIVARYEAIIGRVQLGYRTVRFRPAGVARLVSHLNGDKQIGRTL